MTRYSSSAIVLLAMIPACDIVTGPDAEDRVVGIIEWQSDATHVRVAAADPRTVVAAPDTVTAGVPFTVTITTIGLSGCWSQDGATRSVSGLTANVTPYDRVIEEIDGLPISCTAALVDLPRDISLSFAQTGTATLRVSGRRIRNGDVAGAEPAVIEKLIVVR